ncbi:tyrosine-type recombinase/integrase [Chloroflexota bacterium]
MTPANQQIVLNLIRGLAEKDGTPLACTLAPGLQTPTEGTPLWLASLRAEQYSPRTIQQYRLIAKNYLEYDPYPTFLSIQCYLAERLGKVSPARVAMELKALRSLFRFLHSAGLWVIDPTAKIKSIKVTYREREIPSEEDIARLLRANCHHKKDTPKFRLMVVLLLDTGLRVWEACSIRRNNINIEGLEIRVMGKGRKERVVPISPLTAALLSTWISQDGGSEWLFPASNAQGYWNECSFEKSIRRVCMRHGIKPITPHALRHFFATHNLKNGARLEVVSRILGHASIAITADIYVHVDREDIHSTHKQFSPFARLMLPQVSIRG